MNRSKLSIFVLLAALLTFSPCMGQEIVVKNLQGCAFKGSLPKGVVIKLQNSPTDFAKKYLDTIVSSVGVMTGGEIKLNAADSIKNAVATIYNNKRYILYNPDFLKMLQHDDTLSWANLTILAHEVGHHVNKHNFGEENCQKRREQELEADVYAGKAMRCLCATREEATAAYASLPRSPLPGSCYPSSILRQQTVAQAWKDQDSIFLKNPNADPCRPAEISLIYQVRESLEETNPRAYIYQDRIEFFFTVPPSPERQRVFTHIVVDEKAGKLTQIKSIKWKDFPFTPGPKTVVWDFKKDGLTRNEVKDLSLINICAFDRDPDFTTNLELWSWGGLTAIGAGTTGYAISNLVESLRLSDTYKTYRNPASEQYQSPNLSREETKSEADKKLTIAVYSGIVGGAILTFGLRKLVKRWSRNKRSYILVPNYLGTY